MQLLIANVVLARDMFTSFLHVGIWVGSNMLT